MLHVLLTQEWRWKVDPPELIIENAIAQHVFMVNAMKGVPGVKMDRWVEAATVKHCALSLVGEPIMYPYINQFTRLLHERGISSFLVTNAQVRESCAAFPCAGLFLECVSILSLQFPDQIVTLDPVTQLYVSIDAPTRDSLRKVDRPLFKDFWERYIASLRALKEKKQRTVYRLTLVKAYNMDIDEVDRHLTSLSC